MSLRLHFLKLRCHWARKTLKFWCFYRAPAWWKVDFWNIQSSWPEWWTEKQDFSMRPTIKHQVGVSDCLCFLQFKFSFNQKKLKECWQKWQSRKLFKLMTWTLGCWLCLKNIKTGFINFERYEKTKTSKKLDIKAAWRGPISFWQQQKWFI